LPGEQGTSGCRSLRGSRCCSPGTELCAALGEELGPRRAVRRSRRFRCLPLLPALLHHALGARSGHHCDGDSRDQGEPNWRIHQKSLPPGQTTDTIAGTKPCQPASPFPSANDLRLRSRREGLANPVYGSDVVSTLNQVPETLPSERKLGDGASLVRLHRCPSAGETLNPPAAFNAPPRKPAHSCCSLGWIVVNIWLARLDRRVEHWACTPGRHVIDPFSMDVQPCHNQSMAASSAHGRRQNH
jgi:hypothetical protein